MVVIATITLQACDPKFQSEHLHPKFITKMENGEHVTLLNKSYDLNISQINLGWQNHIVYVSLKTCQVLFDSWAVRVNF